MGVIATGFHDPHFVIYAENVIKQLQEENLSGTFKYADSNSAQKYP